MTLVVPIHPRRDPAPFPDWAVWRASVPYSVGVEEEVMILDPRTGELAAGERVRLDDLSPRLDGHVRGETHEGVAELASSPHRRADGAARETARLRADLRRHLGERSLVAAAAGTHPCAVWTQVRVSDAPRYRMIHDTMRALARREPTFALHVHIGVASAERAVGLANRLRGHLPLLLALSANSPFWQGRDTGLASARIPVFGAFPRVGIPRAFADYPDYVAAVDRLIRAGAIPEPTFLWWDVRLQPRLGTVEVRVMDAQLTAEATEGLVALTQAIARLELESGAPTAAPAAAEVLEENRFLAARDGMQGSLIDPAADRLVPARALLARLLERVREHAQDLGCLDGLAAASELAAHPGAERQRRVVAQAGLPGLLQDLIARFTDR